MAKPDYPEILRTQIDSEDELNLFSEKLSALYDYYEVRSEKTGLIDWRELALNLAMRPLCSRPRSQCDGSSRRLAARVRGAVPATRGEPSIQVLNVIDHNAWPRLHEGGAVASKTEFRKRTST
jgi:hypothetical protein